MKTIKEAIGNVIAYICLAIVVIPFLITLLGILLQPFILLNGAH
jgi:hypothetical protein